MYFFSFTYVYVLIGIGHYFPKFTYFCTIANNLDYFRIYLMQSFHQNLGRYIYCFQTLINYYFLHLIIIVNISFFNLISLSKNNSH